MNGIEIPLTASQQCLMFAGDMYYFNGHGLIHVCNAIDESIKRPKWKELLIKWFNLY